MDAVTATLADWIANDNDPPTPRARRAAAHAVLDWAGVTLAGANDMLVALLIEDCLDEAVRGSHRAIGTSLRLSASAAARINGAASHALDFDDINKRMRGHPTVAILPAILAASQDHTGAQVIDALIAGTEVACVLGEMLGEAHYLHGFHTTATVGNLGAAAGVCRLLGADAETTARALSLAATQASGLRAMFGTMAKPLHAGLAAENGLRAARWAIAGMTAPHDGIESPQGFGPVLSNAFQARLIRPDRAAPFGIEGNVFKQHAACYYTHSAIDAATTLARKHAITPDRIAQVTVGLQDGLHSVCDIVVPKTGLEVKFSIRHLVAMALLGRNTTDPACFTDVLATDAEVVALRAHMSVVSLDTDNRMEALVRIATGDGACPEMRLDVSTPVSDMDAQQAILIAKFERLATPVLGHSALDIAARLLAIDTDTPIAPLIADLAPET